MNLTLNVWRQPNTHTPGRFVTYPANDINPDMSFLEMLDIVNEGLVERGEDPIAFDSDCREGICGICGIVINGIPHGGKGSTTCQLYMRHFREGETVTLEPFRARPFPVLKDLIVDRTALDQIMSAGGFISASVGSAPMSCPVRAASRGAMLRSCCRPWAARCRAGGFPHRLRCAAGAGSSCIPLRPCAGRSCSWLRCAASGRPCWPGACRRA